MIYPINRFYIVQHHQTSFACLGEVTTNIAAWLGQGRGRVWGGSWVIPITHITLQHYIHPTLYSGQVRRSHDKNKIDFTQKRVILKYKLDYQSLEPRPSQ